MADVKRATKAFSLLLMAMLAACGPVATATAPAGQQTLTATPASPGQANSLTGTEWVLTALNGEAPLDGTYITLKLEDAWLGGFAGCNAYGGGPDSGGYLATAEGSLAISSIAITAMECPSPKSVMAQEGAYVEALSSAAAYRRTGERLEVEDAAGETTLVFVQSGIAEAHPDALLGTAWQLVSLNGANPLSNAAITLTFQDAHRISGHAGCRDYLVAYRAEDGELDLFYTGMLGPVCTDEALQEQEGAFTTMLGWTDHFQLNDGLLELLTSRGERLLFEPLPEGAGASLEGATWSLLAFVEPSPAEGLPARLPLTVDVDEGTEITITFEGDALRGSAGCNSYQAGTHLDGSALSVEGVAVTGMACPSPEGVMEQEGRYLGVLKDVTDAQLFGQRLWLETDDGRGLVFRVQE